MVISVLGLILQVLSFVLIARAVLSWFMRPGSEAYKYYMYLVRFTEPIIRPFRGLASRISTPGVPIDLAPMFAMLAIWLLQMVVNWIANFVYRMLMF